MRTDKMCFTKFLMFPVSQLPTQLRVLEKGTGRFPTKEQVIGCCLTVFAKFDLSLTNVFAINVTP